MGAEDTESLYEESNGNIESSLLLWNTSGARRRIPSSADDDDTPPTTPAPNLARFIQHDNRKLDRYKALDENPEALRLYETDVTDQIPLESSSIPTSNIEKRSIDEHRRLITYPPSTTRLLPVHTPVPAAAVLSRASAPLLLPKLDHYLESIPSPSAALFKFRREGRDGKYAMFPPMGRLAGLGKSLEDLETNSIVRPAWRNRNSIFGGLSSIILGVTGSSALAAYYSLQGLFNTVQIFALLLTTLVPHSGPGVSGQWRKLLLGTIPNVLALNFASTLVQSLIYLMVLMTVSSCLLFYFYHSTVRSLRYKLIEGLQPPDTKSRQWDLIIVSFLLTVLYLPLSTMAVHILVWSDDLWVVPNPYLNATSYPPLVEPLGPPDQYRNPLDFCWTTTMRKDEVNFAPVVVIISAVVLIGLTIWFPLCLRRVIKQAVPKVDLYTELGQRRSRSDMDREYQRLLARDRNPFSFLYKGFRRDWGTYEAMYLLAKLTTLMIITLLSPDNCFFRSLPRKPFPVVQQIILLPTMIVFFVLQCVWVPYSDPVNNASEWTSRLNYVATALVSMLVALNIPGRNIINGPILYIIYFVTYGLSFYFTIIDLSIMHRVIKRLARRIDFSIDIFSPRLDISPSSRHARRRIWQESISTLLLTSQDCKIPKEQRMTFSQARDSYYPPYLLGFSGSPAERHVENLKILRDVGGLAYTKGIALMSGPEGPLLQRLEAEIQRHFVGPDCFWKSPAESATLGSSKYFGNAWWIPFPPTLVIRYDGGELAVIDEVASLEQYVSQNSSRDIRRKRGIRLSLRALDGQEVTWPYDYIQPLGARTSWCYGSRGYKARTSMHYTSGFFRVKCRGQLIWKDLQLGSGFDVELTFGKNVHVNGDAIGLNDDYDLTSTLARFLTLNHNSIHQTLGHVEAVLESYRNHRKQECIAKSQALSYRFLTFVYDRPRDPAGLAESSIEFEQDLRVRHLMLGSEAVFETAYSRLAAISSTEVATWWYIFWDDLWRRNHSTISKLRLHSTDFDPHYPTSIAYSPLPRAALEAFLVQRGLLNKIPRFGDFFHAGFLNKMYIRMNDIVFHGSNQATVFHLGDEESKLDMEDVDLETQGQSSTLGTGGGTDHDDSSIRARPRYKWETLFTDPPYGRSKPKRRWFAKMGAWLGITPLWKSGMYSRGISLDVRLENGYYVLLEDQPR